MATKKKAATSTGVPDAPAPDPAPKSDDPVTLRALVNVPRELTGTGARVYRGDTWDAPAGRVHDLTKTRKIAEPA